PTPPVPPAVTPTTGAAAPSPTSTSRPSLTPASASPTPGPNLDPFARAASLQFPSPSALATALAQAESGILAPQTPASTLAGYGLTEEVAIDQLVGQPAWQPTVLAQLPASLRPSVQANINAGSALVSITPPDTSIPPWRIVTPEPQAELLADYQQAQSLYGIPWQYLAAINLVETRMGRIVGPSTAGAQGPMQFIPSTWGEYGHGSIDDPHDAIVAAGHFLSANGGPANMAGALHAYNPSASYVDAVTIYAQQMQQNPQAFSGYYNWQVFVRTTRGDALLTTGYGS
ncbi:MAG: transglycosylase SLT domain-containing protein, partial [Actinomycetota bacterium]